ncbi:hypothetical protein PG994_009623, partial [Apiospora phragmitis]
PSNFNTTGSILWFTWFIVRIFDVRFMTDSIFERVIRIIQVSCMLGFTIVVSTFDPEDPFKDIVDTADKNSLDMNTFQILYHEGLILMTVRISLVAQYCSIYWFCYQGNKHGSNHIKPTGRGKPLLAAAAIHFVAAMIYLGISSLFNYNRDSPLYIVWYIGSAMEATLQLGLACRYEELRFDDTKLTERLAVFTVVVLGEGVSETTKTILLVVQLGGKSIATTYFLYLLYFDWMNHETLSGHRQLIYSLLHFPLHAALLLLGTGSALFIKFWKADYNDRISSWSKTEVGESKFSNKSAAIAESIWNLTMGNDAEYPSKYISTWNDVSVALDNIRSIPDWFWNSTHETNITEYRRLSSIYYSSADTVILAVHDSVFATYELEAKKWSKSSVNSSRSEKMYSRMETTFQYVYASAGAALLLMIVLQALTLPRRRRSSFNYIRLSLFVLAGLFLSLFPLISISKDKAGEDNFIQGPWVLPTICLVVFVVFVLTHLH